jgi:hypothetical protein
MSRRTGSSTFSPTSVIVELHEFDGRWFITERWGSGSGTEIRRPVKKTALGKAVLERIGAARSEWRAFISAADDAENWARFCATVAGVPADQYRPDKRLVILVGQAGMRCHDGQQSPPVWEPLPDKSPRALGAALLKLIGS